MDALSYELGLMPESVKEPAEVLFIDQAEKLSDNEREKRISLELTLPTNRCLRACKGHLDRENKTNNNAVFHNGACVTVSQRRSRADFPDVEPLRSWTV
jgi:hypothetical protein